MAIIYVHGVLGNDANGGTDPETDALATVGAALAAYSDGDTIKIKGGITYNTSTAVTVTNGFTMQPYDTDGEKPVINISDTGLDHWLDIAPSNIAKIFKIYNIMFLLPRNVNLWAIALNPQVNLTDDMEVKNCDFVSSVNEFDSTGPYGICRTDRPAASGGSTIIRVHNCNFIKLRRGAFIYDDTKKTDVVNCLFYMCGKQTTDGAIHVLQITGGGASIKFVACYNSYFYGCSLYGYDLSIPSVDFVNCIGSEAADEVSYPRFVDEEDKDFRIQSDSPLVDQGKAGLNDANRPPAQGISTGDIGSWGGPENLSLSSAMTMTLEDGEFSDGSTSKTVYPYDVVTFTGKKYFFRWDTTDSAVLTKLGNNRYSRTVTLTILPSFGSSFTLKGIYEREIEMTAGRYDFTIEQGATFKRTLVYRDLNEDVIDVSAGYTAAMEIRDRYGGTLIKTLTNGSGITLGATTITIEISDTDTSGFSFKWAVYDLELVKVATGEVTRLLEGKVKLSKNATTL